MRKQTASENNIRQPAAPDEPLAMLRPIHQCRSIAADDHGPQNEGVMAVIAMVLSAQP